MASPGAPAHQPHRRGVDVFVRLHPGRTPPQLNDRMTKNENMNSSDQPGKHNLYPFRWFPAHEVWVGVIGAVAVAEVIAAFLL